ncbi:hypothetical protein ACFQMM_11410 [Saliphagus sp. GCM10025308]
MEAQQEFEDGRLPGPGRTNESDGLAARDVERDVVHDDLLIAVAERHVVVLDAALVDLEVGRVDVGLDAPLFVHQPEDAFGGRLRALVHVDDLSELGHRPDELLGEQDERRELADAEFSGEGARRAVEYPVTAHEERQNEPDTRDNLETGEELDPDGNRPQFVS